MLNRADDGDFMRRRYCLLLNFTPLLADVRDLRPLNLRVQSHPSDGELRASLAFYTTAAIRMCSPVDT